MFKRGLPALAALIATALVFAVGASSALACGYGNFLTINNWSQQDLELKTSDSTGLWVEKPQASLRNSQQTTASLMDVHGIVPFGFKVTYQSKSDPSSSVTFLYGFHATQAQESPMGVQSRGWLKGELTRENGSLVGYIRDQNYNKGV